MIFKEIKGQQRAMEGDKTTRSRKQNTNSVQQLRQQQALVIYSLLPVYRQFPE